MGAEETLKQAGYTSFRRGVFFSSTGSILNITFIFLETVLATHSLQVETFGKYLFLMTIVNFVAVFMDLGCRTSTTRLIASSSSQRQSVLAHAALLFRVLVIIFMSITIWLGQPLLQSVSIELSDYIFYVPLMVATLSVDELLSGIVQGLQNYRAMSIAQVLRSVVRFGLSLVFLMVLQLGVLSLILSWIISYTLSAVYLYRHLPDHKGFVYRHEALVEILRFGFPHLLSRLLWLVFNQVHVLFLGILSGPAAVAAYGVAARIPDALFRLAESFTAVYFPRVASLLAQQNREKAVWFVNQTLRLVSFSTALLVMFAVVFNRTIIGLLFPSEYLVIGGTFALLMLAFHATFGVSLLGYTLTAAGFPGRSLSENVLRTTLTVLGDLLLIPSFGFVAPALATLTSGYLGNIVALRFLKLRGIQVDVVTYLKQTAILLLCCGLYWYFQPTNLLLQFAFIGLFVALNHIFSSITRADFQSIVSADGIRRILPQKAYAVPEVSDEGPSEAKE